MISITIKITCTVYGCTACEIYALYESYAPYDIPVSLLVPPRYDGFTRTEQGFLCNAHASTTPTAIPLSEYFTLSDTEE